MHHEAWFCHDQRQTASECHRSGGTGRRSRPYPRHRTPAGRPHRQHPPPPRLLQLPVRSGRPAADHPAGPGQDHLGGGVDELVLRSPAARRERAPGRGPADLRGARRPPDRPAGGAARLQLSRGGRQRNRRERTVPGAGWADPGEGQPGSHRDQRVYVRDLGRLPDRHRRHPCGLQSMGGRPDGPARRPPPPAAHSGQRPDRLSGRRGRRDGDPVRDPPDQVVPVRHPCQP